MNNRLYAIDTTLLEDEEIFRSQYAKMSFERRKKIDYYHYKKDKRLSLGAGILLCVGFADYQVESEEIVYNKNNKPFLKDSENVFFNISHSGTVAVCAFSDKAVGVDVEEHTHFEQELVRSVFLPKEISYVEKQLFSSDQIYTELWTIKESLMKYLGTGMTLEPKEILVAMDAPVRASTKAYDCSSLNFTAYDVSGYSLTVCSEYDRFSDSIKWIVP